MIRTQIFKVREERDTALLELMLLAVHVDGRVAESSVHAVLRHVRESPEFQGESPEVLEGRLRRSAATMASASDEAIFASLRQRLPDERNRLLAYGLAAKVIVSEAELPNPSEVHQLSRLQLGLEVSPSQARAMLSGLAEGTSPTEVASEPSDLLSARVLELVLLSVGLDACLSPAEIHALNEAREDLPQLWKLGGQMLRRRVFGCQLEAPLEAVQRQLEGLAIVPSTLASRREALRLAVRFSEAIGHGLPQELLLCFVQELFGLTHDDDV
ncbi:hypothetical protein [Archangium violaceum]|uniref:Co-chaperone DjlA N-terminal domain-containing protein n=1 Tax=Archangium violaceum Cb vi76 TaxID=1406225 RepID=A0A084SHN0_9BACT|nr:hypothetical protein [Archangium violaceum]KFA87965.1 hypothetical protein Q664_44395 [Archangium violaceum Cb vi76]